MLFLEDLFIMLDILINMKINEEIWGKPYIKFPVYIGITLGLSLMCLIKNMN